VDFARLPDPALPGHRRYRLPAAQRTMLRLSFT
jgi:hypothetical protein